MLITFHSSVIPSAVPDKETSMEAAAAANKETWAWIKEQRFAGFEVHYMWLGDARSPFDPKAKRVKVVMRKL